MHKKFLFAKRAFAAPLMVLFILTIGGALLVALVDFGRAYLTQSKLQAAADGAALAAIQRYTSFTTDDCDNPRACENNERVLQQQRVAKSIQMARQVARANRIPGLTHQLRLGDVGPSGGIHFGIYDADTENFSEVPEPQRLNERSRQINAVKIDAFMGDNNNENFGTVFGRLINFTGLERVGGEGIASRALEVIPYDYVIALDASGSMLWPGNTDKWTPLISAAIQFLEHVRDERGNAQRSDEMKDRVAILFFGAQTYSITSPGHADYARFADGESNYNSQHFTTKYERVINYLRLYGNGAAGRQALINRLGTLFGPYQGPDSATCDAILNCWNTPPCFLNQGNTTSSGTSHDIPIARGRFLLKANLPKDNGQIDGRMRSFIIATDGIASHGYYNTAGPNTFVPPNRQGPPGFNPGGFQTSYIQPFAKNLAGNWLCNGCVVSDSCPGRVPNIAMQRAFNEISPPLWRRGTAEDYVAFNAMMINLRDEWYDTALQYMNSYRNINEGVVVIGTNPAPFFEQVEETLAEANRLVK